MHASFTLTLYCWLQQEQGQAQRCVKCRVAETQYPYTLGYRNALPRYNHIRQPWCKTIFSEKTTFL